jgi:iron complex outermembrane receptor protein
MISSFHPRLLHAFVCFVSAGAPVFVVSTAVAAQTLFAVTGTVRDTTGAPVPNARVEIVGTPPGRFAHSDAAGRYRIDGLPAGKYTLRADFPGFAPVEVVVTVNDEMASMDIAFATLTAAESLTVTAAAGRQELDVPSQSASRLGLTPRETPATIDIITFAAAQERGLRTATEVLSSVPAVSSAFLPSAQGITAIRGFSGGAVSMLFDGTRVTTSTMIVRNYDSWSFDRIEVLKGPASVLYGEGSLAGTVNLVPKRPEFNGHRGEVLLSYGGLETSRLAAGATGPFANGRAAYRADVVWNTTGNYVVDAESNNVSVNGAVDVRLGNAAVLGFAVDHFRDDYGTSYFGTPIMPREVARDPSDLVTDSRGWVLDKAIRDTNYNVGTGITDVSTTWARARLDWRLSPDWKLTSDLFAYDKFGEWKNSEVYAFDPSIGQLTRSTVGIDHDLRFYGNRTALASDSRIGGRRNRFTAGVEINQNDLLSPRRFGNTTPVDPFAPDRGLFPTEDSAVTFPGAGNRTDFSSTVTQVSVFTEDAVSVAPRLTVIGGVRLDQIDLDRTIDDLNAGVQTTFSRSYSPVSWRSGAVFDLMPQTQLFGQYTYAVAPVATILLISQANAAFELTSGTSVEGGVKATLANGRVDATASVFTIVQDDIVTRDPNNFNVVIQGGKQASTGVEVSISTEWVRGLRLHGTAAFLDARFEELIEAGGVDRAGNVPPSVPERTAGLWLGYQVPSTPLTVSGGVRYQGRFFTNNANSTEVAGFTIIDAQASWRIRSGEITLRGRNLTDTLYADWTGASAGQVNLGAPRSVDLSYHVRF